MCVCVSLSRVRLLATPRTAARQAPLSTGFSRQGYWSGLPFPSPGDFPDPGTEPSLLAQTSWRVMDHAHHAPRQDFHNEQWSKTCSASWNRNIPSSHPLPLGIGRLAGVVVEGGVDCHRFTMSLIGVGTSVSSDPHGGAKVPGSPDSPAVI